MSKPTLLVLAAGLGSRYGGDKQVDGFGPNGETIIEYSIFDAINAGFGKVVFIVREEILQLTKDLFLPRFGDKIQVEFVLQSLESHVPKEFHDTDRVKPYGTAHAVLCAKDAIKEPFAVINADDFYGREAFQKLAGFLMNEAKKDLHCMVGYAIQNVLSENGSVSRGVCEMDDNNQLKGMVERTHIVKEKGKIVSKAENEILELAPDTPVSMNCWGFHPVFFEHTERLWYSFLQENKGNLKSEFYIPMVANTIIREKEGRIKILEGGKIWFGVTYTGDRPGVIESLKTLHEEEIYPVSLW